MAKKQMDNDSTEGLHYLRENLHRADVASGLDSVIDRLNRLTSNRCGFVTRGAKASEIRAVLDTLARKKSASDMNCGLCREDDDGAKKKTVRVQYQYLEGIWERYPSLKESENPTPKDFLKKALSIVESYERAVAENKQIIGTEITPLTAIANNSGKVSSQITPLWESAFPTEPSSVDEDFLYSHIRKSGVDGRYELYWVFEDGETYHLSLKDKGDELYYNTDFFQKWMKYAIPRITDYESKIVRILLDRQESRRDMEQELLDKVPQFMLNSCYVFRRFYETQDGVQDLGLFVGLKDGQSITNKNVAWAKEFARTILAQLDLTYVKKLKPFSNTPGEGLTSFDLSEYDVKGIHGKELAEAADNPPKLPPKWNDFFMGKTGTLPIFTVDTMMCLLRIAYFVTNVVTEGRASRQMLVLQGSGHDGKTIFAETLLRIVGEKNYASIRYTKLDAETEQMSVLNKSLIYMPEIPAKKNTRTAEPFLGHDFLKSITGGDTIAMRQLYCATTMYKPEHAFVLATCNYRVSAVGRHEWSRLLPVSFMVNYYESEAREPLISALYEEHHDFLQWCFDTMAYYKYRKNVNGDTLKLFTGDSLRLYTDVRYTQWLLGGEMTTEDGLEDNDDMDDALAEDDARRTLDRYRRKEALLYREAIHNFGEGRFVTSDEEGQQEDDEETFRIASDAFFEKGDDEDHKTTRAQLRTFMLANAGSPFVEVLNIDWKNTNSGRYKSFMRWLKAKFGTCMVGRNERAFSFRLLPPKKSKEYEALAERF